MNKESRDNQVRNSPQKMIKKSIRLNILQFCVLTRIFFFSICQIPILWVKVESQEPLQNPLRGRGLPRKRTKGLFQNPSFFPGFSLKGHTRKGIRRDLNLNPFLFRGKGTIRCPPFLSPLLARDGGSFAWINIYYFLSKRYLTLSIRKTGQYTARYLVSFHKIHFSLNTITHLSWNRITFLFIFPSAHLSCNSELAQIRLLQLSLSRRRTCT